MISGGVHGGFCRGLKRKKWASWRMVWDEGDGDTWEDLGE